MGAPDRDIAQAKDFIAPPGYSRHRPEATLLYQLVAQHYPAFRDRRAAEGRALPRYVEDEFEAYLKCGLLEHGFLRVKCDACQAEKLVAFSCKRRGFCPSCGARRMAETAAFLVDEVLPAAAHSPVGAVAALRAALPAGDTARGRHAGTRHRLPGDFRPPDPQSRPDPRERGDGRRDPDTALRQCAQSQCALPPARARRRVSPGR